MNAPTRLQFAAVAPGFPGAPPTWTSSAKQVVGGTLGPGRLWFTIGGGIVNEVYYPRIDIPQIRDLGFIVSNGRGFWCEVKRLSHQTLTLPAPGVPAVAVVHHHERFTLTLRIVPDPIRDVLLVDVNLDGDDDLRPYALLAPHLGGTGHGNQAAVTEYRGHTVLWAEQGPFGLALTAADPLQRDAWGQVSAGYVGTSDGWQDFYHNHRMGWAYREAGPGNVALTGELPRQATLALAFGSSKESAATLAATALLKPFADSWDSQVSRWEAWHEANVLQSRDEDDSPDELRDMFRTCAMVLRAHQDKTYPGAMVASLSVPWGNTRDERGGYHLVWPRDLVECAGALLALGAVEEAQEVLRYLLAVQHADGHWYQNQWLGGKPYWTGIQLDQAAFPVLLASALAERNALDGIEVTDMVRRALGFIARTGPASDQDRWEENEGVNTFTLAVCIAALVAGARFLDAKTAELLLDLADFWNNRIEDWTAVYDTALARRLKVRGYYVRGAPAPAANNAEALHRVLPIKNRVEDPGLPADEQVGVDFLQLVRFGLRRPDDPLIKDSVTVADALLKIETPSGPCWHRYNGDGYGEHSSGAPFNGSGRGRGWPLLTGERGHYVLAAGDDPLPYLETMAAMASGGGMIPEQVWDAAPISELDLFPGRPTGSAMPLAWAHAEYIKLTVSRDVGVPFDRPVSVWGRYHGNRPTARWGYWCDHAPLVRLAPGEGLRVCLAYPGTVHWGVDGWQQITDTATVPSSVGWHVAELDTTHLQEGRRVNLTLRNTATGQWVGRDWQLTVADPDPSS